MLCLLQPMDCITYDLCGVCNGDNSSVKIVTGSFSQLRDFGECKIIIFAIDNINPSNLKSIATKDQHIMFSL